MNDKKKQAKKIDGMRVIQTEEAASLLGLRPQTLRLWSSEGSGPIRPVKIGGRLGWRIADLERILKGEKVEDDPLKNSITVNIKKLHPDARIPTYATDGSAAFDLYALTVNGSHRFSSFVTEGYPVLCDTGIAFELPPGYGMFILSRSGQGFKHDTRLSNCVGLLDFDYRGAAQVKLICDQDAPDDKPPFDVAPGDRIAQAVILPIPRVNFCVVDKLTETARGTSGFGSTGK